MHVAITGASSGIGAALAREYLARGASVTLVARRADLLREIAAAVPAGRTHIVSADLSDAGAACDWLAAAEAALGPIDILVNNAGVECTARTAEVPWERAERVLDLNLVVPLKLTRALLPGMIARRSGAIVDVSSVAALVTPPGMAFYGASKAGLAAASESLRAELRGTGVHVVTVYPGPIHTDMGRRGNDALEPSFGARLVPWGQADILARKIADAVERRRSRVIYPALYALLRWLGPIARLLTDLSAPAVAAPQAPRPVVVGPRG